MGRLIVTRVEGLAGLRELEREWTMLERVAQNNLPFRTYTWTECWWTHLREDRPPVRDQLALRAVRTREGILVAVAPFMITERPRFGPLRSRCLQLIGTDPNVTEIRGALCDPAYEAEVHTAILDDLRTEDVDWVHWTGLEDRPAVCQNLNGAADHWGEGVADCVLRLPATFDELRACGSRNLKEALRHCCNRMKREGVNFTLEVSTRPDAPGTRLDDFFRLHAARARLDDTVTHRDVFAHPSCRLFLEAVCRRLADRGELRIFGLRVDNAVVAARIGFLVGRSLYLYYSGFDPAYRTYGVASTLTAEAIKYAIGMQLAEVNLSTGLDTWKLRWRPQVVFYRDALILSPEPLGRAKFAIASAAKRWAQKSPVGQLVARRA